MQTPDSLTLANAIAGDIGAIERPTTDSIRTVRRLYTAALKSAPAATVIELTAHLSEHGVPPWVGYELIRFHRPAFESLDDEALDGLSSGIAGWEVVDAFARTLSGPAWLRGQASDELIVKWADDPDLWRRRAALVSTVALNMRSQGGTGDTRRTLMVCEPLVADLEDMLVKAMSWALRELLVHDPAAVSAFLTRHQDKLSPRVKREVRNKATSGLKNPPSSRSSI